MAAQLAEWPVLTAILRASILISEWVSLRDHCTVWGLGLHHSRKFIRPLRKPKLARRSLVPFLQSKALTYFPHFYPDKFYNGSQVEENCQISLLLNHLANPIESPTTERPWHLSAEPQVFLDFFPIKPPSPVPFHWVGNSPAICQPASYPASFDWVGISWYLSTKPHSLSKPWVGVPQTFHLGTTPHPHQYLFYWEEAGNLLHHQIKLRISTNMGDPRNRRILPKFVCTLRGGKWAQVAAAGTKAPVPGRVQWKEGSPLWVPAWLP